MKATSRTERAYKTHHVTWKMAQIECLHCGTMHTVDRGEDGPDVDFVPCQGNDACEAMLCVECRHQCGCCGLYACEQHVKVANRERTCHICLERPEPECECSVHRGRWDLEERWDASMCPIHGGGKHAA